ncbi:MAG: 16S rRNA (adenine(1518)-N(6)/adenine(1519)-N(6))-dimethyltransferase RsmA [Anaerolineae bacterium]|nr:16S rRNA (adenine(1518)-N(6)/adenine(1519)-N(6))-dimethyltransferase RsmA [Anaerolineae bacterium]
MVGAEPSHVGHQHTVRQLLRAYGLRPRRELGQNFLEDPAILRRIVDAAELTTDDLVLEVGPGLGTLTRPLAAQAGRVVAVELDQQLVSILRQELADCLNVEIVHGDILALDPATLLPEWPGEYKVVANLPYYITSAVLRHLLESPLRPRLMVLTLQLEVARRLVAGPGEMSLLAVSVQFYGKPRIVTRISAGSFYPSPQVDSAVVRIDVYERPPVPVDDADSFFRVVQAGFAQRRKQLRNALAHGLRRPVGEVVAALERAGIDPRRRAETLSLMEWAALWRELAAVG